MNSVLRDRQVDVRAIGLILVAVERAGRHLKFIVKTPDGRVGMLTTSRSPSDRNVRQRFRADLRRFIAGR